MAAVSESDVSESDGKKSSSKPKIPLLPSFLAKTPEELSEFSIAPVKSTAPEGYSMRKIRALALPLSDKQTGEKQFENAMYEFADIVVSSDFLFSKWLKEVEYVIEETHSIDTCNIALDHLKVLKTSCSEFIRVCFECNCSGVEKKVESIKPTKEAPLDSDEWCDKLTVDGGRVELFDWIFLNSWRMALFLHGMRLSNIARATESENVMWVATRNVAEFWDAVYEDE
jgi:hypothetical protein